MSDIFLERGDRKEYTKEDIASVLIALDPTEPYCAFNIYEESEERSWEDEAVMYSLHLDYDGNILESINGETTTLTAYALIRDFHVSKKDIQEYGMDEDGYFNWWDSSFLTDHATLKCEAFADVVDQLVAQANDFLQMVDDGIVIPSLPWLWV